MSGVFYRILLLLLLLLITLCTIEGYTPVATALAHSSTSTSNYLSLAVTPASASVGSVVTLHITYHGLGMPNTTILIEPNDALVFDPPQSMPCRYDRDTTGCTEMTLRAHIRGTATIHASANGEIHDTDCGCWRWAYENASTIVTIMDNRIFLPVVRRYGPTPQTTRLYSRQSNR